MRRKVALKIIKPGMNTHTSGTPRPRASSSGRRAPFSRSTAAVNTPTRWREFIWCQFIFSAEKMN